MHDVGVVGQRQAGRAPPLLQCQSVCQCLCCPAVGDHKVGSQEVDEDLREKDEA